MKFIQLQFISWLFASALFALMGGTIDALISLAWGLTTLGPEARVLVMVWAIPVALFIHCIWLSIWWFSFCALNERWRRIAKRAVIMQWVTVLLLPFLHAVLFLGAVLCWVGSWLTLLDRR